MNALLIQIEDTSKSYLAACNATSEANRNETALLNELNNLQKKFDEQLKTIKAQAPRDTRWKRGALDIYKVIA